MSLMDSKNIQYIDVEEEEEMIQMRQGKPTESAIVLESRPLSERKKSDTSLAKKEKNYGWAFFLSSALFGIGLTATFDIPVFLFMGLAFGFLFFVDPIYQKLMEKINSL